MAIDYAETIRYISDNMDKVNLTQEDLEAIKRTLSLIKAHVEQQIIETAVRNSPEIKRQLDEAKEKVQKRMAELKEKAADAQSKMKYPEYTPKDIPETVPGVIVEGVENKKRENYNKNRDFYLASMGPEVEAELQRLNQLMDFYESVKPYTENPDRFIEEFLKNRFGEQGQDNPELQKLVDLCATNMAYGYMEMETSRVADKNKGEELPPMAGEPLFIHTGKSNSDGYSINPDALSPFLDLIRDNDLVEELTRFDEVYTKGLELASRLTEKNTDLNELNESKKSLENKELYSEFEKTITSAADILEQQTSIDEQLYQLDLPANSNIFARAWGWLTGSSRANDQKREELKAKKDALIEQYNKLRAGYITRLNEDDPDFKKLNELYIFGITEHRPNEGFYSPTSNPDSDFYDLAQGVINYRSSKAHEDGTSIHAVVTEKSQLDTKISTLQEDINLNKNTYSQLIDERDAMYEKLSPKAKELTDKSPRGAVPMMGIKKRYIEASKNDRYSDVSPFVSSLILEAIFKMHDIKTPQDADKFGIEFGVFDTARMKDDSIAEAIQAIKDMVTPFEERE